MCIAGQDPLETEVTDSILPTEDQVVAEVDQDQVEETIDPRDSTIEEVDLPWTVTEMAVEVAIETVASEIEGQTEDPLWTTTEMEEEETSTTAAE